MNAIKEEEFQHRDSEDLSCTEKCILESTLSVSLLPCIPVLKNFLESSFFYTDQPNGLPEMIQAVHCFNTVIYMQFGVDVFQVLGYGMHTDVQFGGHFFYCQPR